jgi:Glycosyl transferase family 2
MVARSDSIKGCPVSTDATDSTEERAQARPSVSVLLPAWNEAEMLGRCLDSLLCLNWPELEIVLCAGGNDGTLEIATRYSEDYPGRILLLRQHPGEGKQNALHRCFERSRGELIYLTDADCVIPAETLSRMVAAVGPGGSDAATGPAEPLPEQRERAWIRHQWATVRAVDRERTPDATGILGRNCAVRRSGLEAAGGFNEAVATGTDYYLAQQLLAAGRTIQFVPAPVQTRYAEGIAEYLGQQSRWLRNVIVHGPRFGDQTEAEVKAVTKTLALGVGILAWPLTWRWTRLPGVGLWVLLISGMARVRLKQQRDLEAEADLKPTRLVPAVFRAVLYSFIDLIVWARPVSDLLTAGRRRRW